MLKYIFRRALQMIPTVLGVILITFVLFNVVGGSPAAMTLGKHVTPRALEDFDEQRGFNKPLFIGRWTRTRAFTDTTFDVNAGIWNQVEGVHYEPAAGAMAGHIVLAEGAYGAPLAFSLRPDVPYEWKFVYRLAEGGRANLARTPPAAEPGLQAESTVLYAFDPSPAWREATVRFVSRGEGPGGQVFEVEGGSLEIRSARLRRKVANPFDSQLVFYLKQIARFDFGVSNSTNQRVSRMLRDGILPSLSLTVPIFFGGVIISISLSLVCAFFRDRFVDRFLVVLSVGLLSINYIVWIILGQYLLGFRLNWFPVWGFESWRFLLLPVFIGIVSGLGGSIRLYRTIMLDEVYKDYVRTAFAKGVGKPAVLFKHVLMNAMIPVVTNVVITIPFLYTGSLLLESFFGIPGLGYMGINAINSSDIDVVRALVLIGAIMFVIANLVTDLCYVLVDPRVKLQ